MIEEITNDYRPVGGARELLLSREKEVLLAGPAGTGKTRAALEKMYLCLLRFERMRALLVRKTRVSLTQSALVTLEEKVIPRGDAVLCGPTRACRNSYTFANGSQLVVGGMDNADRVMSSEYDMVLACEATELTLEDWEKLITRLRNGKMPFQQAIAECNPSYPNHWLNTRAANGLMQRINSIHQDNPVYFDHGKNDWTEEGKLYLSTLQRLSGVRRRRLLDGVWAAPEGLVYESFADHILEAGEDFDLDKLPAKVRRVCAAVDWGWHDPAAVVVAAECEDNVIYIIDEIYATELPTPELIKKCVRMVGRWNVDVWYADRARPDLMNLFGRYDMVMRTPKMVSVEGGIARVDSRLLTDGLKIYDRCGALINEATQYQYGTKTGENGTEKTAQKALRGKDHAMDALRYLVTGMEDSADFDTLITCQSPENSELKIATTTAQRNEGTTLFGSTIGAFMASATEEITLLKPITSYDVIGVYSQPQITPSHRTYRQYSDYIF